MWVHGKLTGDCYAKGFDVGDSLNAIGLQMRNGKWATFGLLFASGLLLF